MSSPAREDDYLTNFGLVIVAAVPGLALILHTAGRATAWMAGDPQPARGTAAALRVLGHPTGPGKALGAADLNVFIYWAVVLLFVVVVFGIGWLAWLVTDRLRTGTNDDPHRLAGTATNAQVTAAASSKALLGRASTLRPSLTHPRPADVGYLLGESRGRKVWATVEDSILLIGPPRSGKGLHVVINAILDAPGAVVTTSTRPDNLTVTMRARERAGPVAVFDPQQLAPGLPPGVRWSPVRGCDDALTAMIRATGLATATDFGSVTGGDFWQGKTIAAIQALLHAAALDGRDAATLYRWAINATAAADAVRILNTNPRATTGWADSLESMLDADPKTRDSIWQGVSLAFSAFADPRVLAAVTPGPGEAFDPEDFLQRNGTMYLLATGSGAGASASLVAAFIEDLVETARKLAARSPGARLDPPLLLALDEIGNLAPLPSLPMLMAEGGGTGITTMPVLQSLAQAREKWGDNNAGAIWDASIVKIILGGGSNSRDLQDLSALMGEQDETTSSTTIDARGGRSHQISLRRLPVLAPERVRTLPFGTGVILLRTAPPIIARLRRWTQRPNATQLQDDKSAVERTLQRR
ncbi:MAG: type secretion protein [Aeromicrobium sp.]|nr:type secretion protein [Aeromicrobium sp.]